MSHLNYFRLEPVHKPFQSPFAVLLHWVNTIDISEQIAEPTCHEVTQVHIHLINFRESPAFHKNCVLMGHRSSKARHNATSPTGAKPSHQLDRHHTTASFYFPDVRNIPKLPPN
jgi:hypothetical protein